MSEKRTLKESLGISLRGMLMGSADVVPGVSGGTIAFITGIYQELLDSISSINITAFKLLLKGKFIEFSKAINFRFFAFLLAGIAVSVVTLSKLISEVVNEPKETQAKVLLWAFFFGLIVSSINYMGKQIKTWNWKVVVSLVLGGVFAYWVTIASPAAGIDASWYYFLAGFIAICAMILPGISGSFILLLMGAYPVIMKSISGLVDGLKSFDFSLMQEPLIIVGLFGAGCIAGLLSFARLVSYLFKKAPQITLAVLTGFLIGSLNKVWPWKRTIEFRENSSGEEVPYLQTNLSPSEFMDLQGDNYMVMTVLMMVLGYALVIGIELMGKKMGKQDA